MATWDHALELDTDRRGPPLFVRIVEGLSRDIRSGVLAPGCKLPGSRRMAQQLGVHRNTVLAALRELEREGFITTEPARGTFVCNELPDAGMPKRATARSGVAYRLPPEQLEDAELPAAGDLLLLGGAPDVRDVPSAALARAYRRALKSADLLGYGDAAGDVQLRTGIAGMLARTRGMATTPDELLITRGSQMGLDLIARVLLGPRSRVAVENLGYPPAREALCAYGARLVTIEVDRDGLNVDALARRLETTRIDAVYLTPHHHYPTTVMLSAHRRSALIALARKHRFAIIEDDYDHEFHYDGRPVRPLAATASDAVIYVGTLSKILAPGLRVGWIAAPPALTRRLIQRRVHVDRQGDLVLERALAELLEDGEVQRHALRMRRRYHARRDAFVQLLHDTFGDRLQFEVPAGGMALWTHVQDADPLGWEERARQRGVWIQAGPRFHVRRRSIPYVRLGYGALALPELRDAVRRLAQCIDD